MAYQIKETVYELKLIDPIDGSNPYYIVREVWDGEPPNQRTVMRGTFEQCKAWLDDESGHFSLNG